MLRTVLITTALLTATAAAAPVAFIAPSVVDYAAQLAAASDRKLPEVAMLTTDPVAAENMKGASSGFGWRNDPINHNRKFHGGSDIRGERGVPVMAAGDGKVIFCGRAGGYGNVIFVDHGNGIVTRYGHLQRTIAKRGDLVTAGTLIGKLGSTGRTTGPHLHFEVRIDGNPVDPNVALRVAAIQRDSATQGKLAAFALLPEIQSRVESQIDPPKGSRTDREQRAAREKRAKESRPERSGRTRRTLPTT